MNYEEAVAYILDVPKFTKKNTLDNTRAVLERLGRPDRRMKLIHVAGTNGKGSVCAYLASILKAAGKKTGLFTSPHLAVINERFQMDQEMISDELFLEGFEAVMEAVHALLEERPDTFSHPTFFELLFLMGMYLFDKYGMEYAVLETGLGGRFDATNVIEKPLVSGVSGGHARADCRRKSRDHQRRLSGGLRRNPQGRGGCDSGKSRANACQSLCDPPGYV